MTIAERLSAFSMKQKIAAGLGVVGILFALGACCCGIGLAFWLWPGGERSKLMAEFERKDDNPLAFMVKPTKITPAKIQIR